jgi:hypothetical protein
LPVVVRRDVNENHDIPVGVRGMKREQRAAGWVKAEAVSRVVTPEALTDRERLLHSPFVSQPPVQAAILLTTLRGRGCGALPAAPAMRWPAKFPFCTPTAISIC